MLTPMRWLWWVYMHFKEDLSHSSFKHSDTAGIKCLVLTHTGKQVTFSQDLLPRPEQPVTKLKQWDMVKGKKSIILCKLGNQWSSGVVWGRRVIVGCRGVGMGRESVSTSA